jgi:uncharacterized membrane protein
VIVFYLLEPEDDFVRFHAARSIVTSGIRRRWEWSS